MQKTIIASLLAVSISLTSFNLISGPKEFYYKKYMQDLENKSSMLSANSSIYDGIFEYNFGQLIDHNDPSLGSFAQRYYIDETYSTSDSSPVFFYICGEATCTKRSLNGSIRELAKKFNAKMIALEHRYYGKSIPTKSFSTEDLKYLTTDFAIRDLERFQKNIIVNRNWTGKWITFGGSYPGNLSAYYRLKHPELVTGALASSAPVMAQEDFDLYDYHVASVAGPECLAKIKASVDVAESALLDQEKFNNIKKMFSAESIENNIDFIYLMADIASLAIQYGMKDDFCNQLENSETPIEGYAQYANHIYDTWGLTPLSFTPEGAMNTDINVDDGYFGMRQWYYQVCTEYGYWQNAYPDYTKSSRSSLINLDYHKQVCERLFNIKYNLDTSKINKEYYFPLLSNRVSNIYFTNGSTDPWSNLSMTDKIGNSTNPNLDYYMIDGAAHCDDLRISKESDSDSLIGSRVKLAELIQKWIS